MQSQAIIVILHYFKAKFDYRYFILRFLRIHTRKSAHLNQNRPGVFKKRVFGHSGGGKLIHTLTFWERLIKFLWLSIVKIDFII